jgi:hypothetical protein
MTDTESLIDAIDTDEIARQVSEGILSIYVADLETAAQHAIMDYLEPHDRKVFVGNVVRALPLHLKSTGARLLENTHPYLWKRDGNKVSGI